MIPVIFIAVVAVLWRLGGWNKAGWSGFRDVLVPVALGAWYAVTLSWWMFFVEGALANTIRIGYGEPTPDDPKPSFLGRIFRVGWIIRGVYGLITSVAIGIGPAMYTGKWFLFWLYVAANFLLEITLNIIKAGDWPTELLNGAGRASIILLCR